MASPDRGSQSPRSAFGNQSELSHSSTVAAWQRQRREEILLLKKSVPSKAELLRIMDSHPSEGERLVRFCRSIQAKIKEMEAEYRASVQQTEMARIEEAKARAAALYAEKKKEVVEKFMEKTLTAEDRNAELAEQRRREREEKLARAFVRKEEAEEERLQREAERLAQLESKRSSWNRAVAMIAEKRVQMRDESEVRFQREQQEYEARRQAERQAHAEEQAKLSALVRKLERDVYEHHQRHQVRLMNRQQGAARFAHATIAHPETFEERVERHRHKVAHKDEKINQSQGFVQERKKTIAQGVRADREARLQRAHERLSAQQQDQERRAREVEMALNERLGRHAHNIEERQKDFETKAAEQAKKLNKCRSAVADNQEQKFAALSQKIIDRTLRIGSALGVDLPPVLPPSTMYITASAPRPERRRRPASSLDDQSSHKPNAGRQRPAGRSVSAPPDAHQNASDKRLEQAKHDGQTSHQARPSLLVMAASLHVGKGELLKTAASLWSNSRDPVAHVVAPDRSMIAEASSTDAKDEFPLLKGLSLLVVGASVSSGGTLPLVRLAASLSPEASLLHCLGGTTPSLSAPPRDRTPTPLELVARMTPPHSATRFVATHVSDPVPSRSRADPPLGLSLLLGSVATADELPALQIVMDAFRNQHEHHV